MEANRRRWVWAVVTAGAFATASLAGLAAADDVNEPRFEQIAEDGDFELRRYGNLLVARTELDSDFGRSQNQGFRRLAKFIFGGNAREQSIAMTAPVGHVETETGYAVTFVMPSQHSMETLPSPNDSRVTVLERPARTVAVLRFSGLVRKGKMLRKVEQLRTLMKQRGLKASGAPELAQYDPPWRLPFLRRNEIMIPVTPAALQES